MNFRRVALALAPFTLLACALGSTANPQYDPPATSTSLVKQGAAFVAQEGCAGCHQSHGASDGILSGSDVPKGGKKAFPKNLTPDLETGIGMWTDAQIIGAMRMGTDDQAMALCDVMPRFSAMKDDEATAIVAYLRSLPAVKRDIPSSECDGPATENDGGANEASAAPDGGGDGATLDAPTTTGATPAAPGELVVSEVMFDPMGSEPNEEWFEIYNTTSDAKLLSGLTLTASGGRSHLIAASPVLTIAPHEFALFLRNRAAASAVSLPGAATAYEYGAGLTGTQGIILTNGSTGSIALSVGTTELASAHFGSFALTHRGSSIQKKTLTATASLASDWCTSHAVWPGGNGAGTPGAANDCP